MIIERRFLGQDHDGPYCNTRIRTDFTPTEIVAFRADGTSESTNPEAANLRELKNQLTLANDGARRLSESFDRIESMTGGGLRNIEQTISALVSERDELKAKIGKINAELTLKNKWIEGARELEVIRSRLAESMVYI